MAKPTDKSRPLYYIFILHQTTTSFTSACGLPMLYYIFILHQTTTPKCLFTLICLLYYIFILHQTTTRRAGGHNESRCIISSFYIKPQPNPNVSDLANSCIISSFYIKPQHGIATQQEQFELYYIFILHQTTTWVVDNSPRLLLYYIFILHQTTTYTTYIADIQPFENHIGRYEVV